MSTYLIAMGLILAVMTGWIAVQRIARRFAARHPEYGPTRECLGCGLGCACEEQDASKITDHTNAKPQQSSAMNHKPTTMETPS